MNERKHLTANEAEKLLTAIKASCNEARDRCFLLLIFRHGLRVGSLRLEAAPSGQRSGNSFIVARHYGVR